MAFDHTTGEIYEDNRGSIPAGHYSRRAAEYDDALAGSIPSIFEDPVVVAQREAAEAAMDVNLTSFRTPEEIVRADMLSRQAAAMASGANLALPGVTETA